MQKTFTYDYGCTCLVQKRKKRNAGKLGALFTALFVVGFAWILLTKTIYVHPRIRRDFK